MRTGADGFCVAVRCRPLVYPGVKYFRVVDVCSDAVISCGGKIIDAGGKSFCFCSTGSKAVGIDYAVDW